LEKKIRFETNGVDRQKVAQSVIDTYNICLKTLIINVEASNKTKQC